MDVRICRQQFKKAINYVRLIGTGTAVELPRQRAKGGDSFVGFSTARESLYSPNFIELFSFGRQQSLKLNGTDIWLGRTRWKLFGVFKIL